MNPWVVAVGLVSLFVVGVVAQFAWLSEDCFITLRYVSNTLQGYGAVFNVGERVQGYSHPLWYLALLPGCYALGDEILASVGYGLVLTFILVIVLACGLRRASERPWISLSLLALASACLISSDPWVSFQTSGLENPLSHLILVFVVAECFFHSGHRPMRLLFLLGLLCLTRPDFVFFCVPLGVLVLIVNGLRRALTATFVGGAPCFAWLAFSWLYYHDIVPNTARAKLEIYPSTLHALTQGAKYLVDWCVHDSAAAASALVLLSCAILMEKRKGVLALVMGILAHALWAVWVGGDFMRGRFFMPALTASVALGALALASRSRQCAAGVPGAVWCTCVCLFLAAAARQTILSSFSWRVKGWGIVNERNYYPGYSLRYYLQNGRLKNPYLDLSFADCLRAYAEAHGPITVHFRNPGTVGYLAGPKVTVIDTLGLTDRYIAGLPRAFLSHPFPRPGHPDKYIPVRYLAARGDLSLLPSWQDRIQSSDDTLMAEIEQYSNSSKFWSRRGIANVERLLTHEDGGRKGGIGIGTPLAERPSHTTDRTESRIRRGGSAGEVGATSQGTSQTGR